VVEKFKSNQASGIGVDISMSEDDVNLEMSKENITNKILQSESMHEIVHNISSFIFEMDDMQFRNA